MSGRWLLVLSMLFWGTTAMAQEFRPHADLQSRLEDRLEQTRAARRMPGAAVTLLSAEDGIIAQAVSGVRRNGEVDPVQLSDKWHLGSDAKAMTAALYAVLVEAGEAKWGATIPELFPNLAGEIDPAWSGVTIEHLLSHHSGMGDFAFTRINAMRADERPIVEQRAAVAREVLTKPPKKTIGKFSYSNQGYVVAGAAIEAITGQPWEEAIRARLFSRLEHGDEFGFGPPQGAQPEGHRKAFVFSRPSPVGQDVLRADNPVLLGPAGTIHASHAAWADFIKLFLAPGDVLSEDSITHLTTPFAGEDKIEYALGWGLGRSRHIETPVLNHAGSNTMWYALVALSREEGFAVLTTTNRGGFTIDRAFAELSDEMFGVWLDAAEDDASATAPATPAADNAQDTAAPGARPHHGGEDAPPRPN